MTERGRSSLTAESQGLGIGPSSVRWDGEGLVFEIDEATMPLPGRVRGRVRVRPSAVTSHVETLDAEGRHRWWPVAPASRVEVELDRPSLRWSGAGYFDCNWGDAPLAQDFPDWDWCRAPVGPQGRDGAAIVYDVRRRDGSGKVIAIRIDRAGQVESFAVPPRVALPGSFWWRINRGVRCESGGTAAVRETLVDAPFYARSVVATRMAGQDVTAIHESLSLDRFDSTWVQVLLPFRMPRLAR
ncbi:carotenoid 1,2-hydratase [Rhodospirillum centenum]|uniref:carotenoid 1,2-hydratase n=1 Tax=Rhodospirillum centenum TaxID=34018 RepID=UPI0017E56517|nr:carotenoid 1,2-hydratase [Rhodospirillum centenum]